MEIPHTVVHKYEFDKESYKLVAAAATRNNPNYKAGTGQIALILNCCLWRGFCINPEHKSAGKSDQPRLRVCVGEDHILHSARFSDHTIKKIKSFVENGGYLFTED
ncbi:unnamed protein product [marine sediment metagenome]|uniref:Uncharacterized protein n=1 Tax=marine sediment metagenome TaxID=412755 RepID=X1LYC4_9ZZZZ